MKKILFILIVMANSSFCMDKQPVADTDLYEFRFSSLAVSRCKCAANCQCDKNKNLKIVEGPHEQRNTGKAVLHYKKEGFWAKFAKKVGMKQQN